MTTLSAKNVQARGNILNGIDRILSVPRVKAYRSAAVTITANTHYAVQFDGAEYNTDGMWSSALPTRLTVKTAGLYLVNGSAEYNAAANENVWTRILANAGGLIASLTQWGMGGAFGTHQCPTGFWNAKAGDYFEMTLYTQANNTGIFTSSASCYLQACLLSTP